MRRTAKKRSIGPLSLLYSIIIFIFLYAPIFVLIVYSFNESKSRGHWGGFSLKWYESLFQNEAIMESLSVTLSVAVLSSLIAVIVGTAAALGMYYSRRRIRTIMMNVTYIPVLNPDIVTGISLLILFSVIGISLGYTSLLIAHITFNIPYIVLSVMPKLNQLDKHIYEAAVDLGAPPLTAFRKVVLPELMPGVVTGFVLAFTMSIDDFVISFFTGGPDATTLSVTIFSMAKRGIKPEINALSTIMFVVVLALLIVVNVRSSRDTRRAVRENPNGNSFL